MFTFLVFAEASEDDVYGTGCYFNKVHIDFTSIFKCGNTTVVFMALIFRGGYWICKRCNHGNDMVMMIDDDDWWWWGWWWLMMMRMTGFGSSWSPRILLFGFQIQLPILISKALDLSLKVFWKAEDIETVTYGRWRPEGNQEVTFVHVKRQSKGHEYIYISGPFIGRWWSLFNKLFLWLWLSFLL